MDSELSPQELTGLIATFGEPERRHILIDGDPYLIKTRRMRAMDRRGEVVIVLRRPGDLVLLHRKSWYEPGIYRFPTGGVDHGELIADALERELFEETGLDLVDAAFMGILRCEISGVDCSVVFDSYVFHVLRSSGQLRLPDTKEDISDFREVNLDGLLQAVRDLQRVPPPRSGWGAWRAVAHAFVHEKLRQV